MNGASIVPLWNRYFAQHFDTHRMQRSTLAELQAAYFYSKIHSLSVQAGNDTPFQPFSVC